MRDALLAFILWGSWAGYSNAGHGIETVLLVAIVQGSASLLMTLLLAYLVQRLFNHFHHPMGKLILPAVLTVTFSASTLLLIHLLIATPNLLQTILPPITVAALYCLYLTRRHWRAYTNQGA